MYDTQLWPAGIYVRRYFEARTPRANSDAHGSRGGSDPQQQRSVSDITSAAQESNQLGALSEVK